MPRDSVKERSRKYGTSDSSDSEYSQHSSKRKYRNDRSKRSRSREKSSHHRKRSSSRSKRKTKRDDSRSPIRYYSSKRRSSSRDRTSRRKLSRSLSRERSKSRSRDRSDYSRSKYKKSSSSHKSSKTNYDSKKRSSSRSVSPYNSKEAPMVELTKKYIMDDTETKIEKAIKAAEAAGLTMCKLPSYEYKEVEVKEDMPTIQDRNVLDELNSDSFTPKQFTSSRSKKIPENIVIDLDAGTVKVPEVELPKVESLFHPDLFPDEKIRMEKWVKKMFQFRQKALRGEI